MKIPIYLNFLPPHFNFHFIMETLAFIVGFRIYWHQRKYQKDPLSTIERLATIIGAMFGALLGSRIIGVLELPNAQWLFDLNTIMFNKSIAGGFLGGLLGVEIMKKIIGIKISTGDAYVFPILIALIIGRTGCWLSGILDGTFGNPTSFFMAMDLGDGIYRHPTALYEIIFCISLLFLFWKLKNKVFVSGFRFKLFMIFYFGFRFVVEWIKPHQILAFNLSVIQWSSIVTWSFYIAEYQLNKPKKYAR